MKHLRKKIFMVMVLIFSISVLVPVSAYAASPDSVDQPITGIAPYNNNVNRCHTSFIIINGTAVVDAAYTGYSNITTEAIIEIKIQKKTLFWWTDVANGQPNNTWTDHFYTCEGNVSHTLPIGQKGTYRVIVKYTVKGTGGSDDVINDTAYYDYN